MIARPRTDSSRFDILGKSYAPEISPTLNAVFIQPIHSTPTPTTSRKNNGSSAENAPKPNHTAVPERIT